MKIALMIIFGGATILMVGYVILVMAHKDPNGDSMFSVIWNKIFHKK